MIQGDTGAVVINISPAMFILAVLAFFGGLVGQAIWLTRWATRLEVHVEAIPALRDARHRHDQEVLVLQSRTDAVEKWIDGQHEDDRTLRTAMAEMMKRQWDGVEDRRQRPQRESAG